MQAKQSARWQLVDEWFAQVEGVLDEANLVRFFGAAGDDDFDDVEAEVNPGVAEHAQVIERGFAEIALLVAVDRFARCAELLGLACFDFDEHKPVLVSGDEINLGFATAKILQENLVAASTKISRGGFFAARAKDLAGCEIARFLKPAEEHSQSAANSTCTGSTAWRTGAKERRCTGDGPY